MPNHAEQLAQELNLNVKNVQGAIELIDQGNTIPFIARYRKEATGSMDDQVLRDLGDRLEYLRGLDKRKDEVTSSITEQGAMTPELTAALSKAKTLAEVEDIYRPYKPKRKTRASIAKARGLQPLATAIFRQDAAFDPARAAADYLNDEVPDAAAALTGAQDIIAEAVSDDAACRAELRRYYRAFGRVASAKAKDEDSVYAQYYDYAEPLNKIPGHRVLALDRGEREGFLKVTIQVDAERAAGIVSWMFARKKTGGKSAELVDAAARDAYSRLIHPSLENELRDELAAWHGVTRENTCVGNGGDELLYNYLLAFGGAGRTLLNCPPCFSEYAFFASLCQTEVRDVWRDPASFELDQAAVLSAAP